MRLLAMLLALALAAGGAAAQPRDCGPLFEGLTGNGYALSGDTLAMMVKGGRTPDVRLFGIRAPHLGDRGGRENLAGLQSRAALSDMLISANWAVACNAMAWDESCRVIADCTADKLMLSREMLVRGYAYSDPHFALRGEPVAQAYEWMEQKARKERRGLWRHWLGPAK
jgi:endonuclease YncB( thermonuclease family)